MAKTTNRDGLTLLQGQVSVDATAGISVGDMDMIEFETVGDATIAYGAGGTPDTYTVPNAGTRVSLKGSDVVTITFAGNISWS